MGELSIALVWHRRFSGGKAPDQAEAKTKRWILEPRMADFDLTLVRLDDEGRRHEVARSASRIDNVEYIRRRGTGSGSYRVEVSRTDKLDEPWDYALAWRIARSTRRKPQ